MKAMVLTEIGQPLILEERPIPRPRDGQILVKVLACGVCRTDLHLIDGELPDIQTPIVPGHEVIGVVESLGANSPVNLGDMVGIPWLGWTCGICDYCRRGKENLCDDARFNGYHLDGGYSEYMLVDHRYCISMAKLSDAVQNAPLLCAGLIGYRCLRMAQRATDEIERIGLFGFGAAAHIIAQLIVQQGQEFYAFTRPGDRRSQEFAYEIGAKWAGDSGTAPSQLLDAAIIFAPVGELIPEALRIIRKGGVVVCGGIHMSEIKAFSYDLLWGERQIISVANLTRADGHEFFELLGERKVTTHVRPYPLCEANDALNDLREGKLSGAAVLVP